MSSIALGMNFVDAIEDAIEPRRTHGPARVADLDSARAVWLSLGFLSGAILMLLLRHLA